MPRTTNLLTISLQRPLLKSIKREARRRDTTISELLRDAFVSYTRDTVYVYSDKELAFLLKEDRISSGLRKDLDRLLKS